MEKLVKIGGSFYNMCKRCQLEHVLMIVKRFQWAIAGICVGVMLLLAIRQIYAFQLVLDQKKKEKKEKLRYESLFCYGRTRGWSQTKNKIHCWVMKNLLLEETFLDHSKEDNS